MLYVLNDVVFELYQTKFLYFSFGSLIFHFFFVLLSMCNKRDVALCFMSQIIASKRCMWIEIDLCLLGESKPKLNLN